jgi:hypothetical protein
MTHRVALAPIEAQLCPADVVGHGKRLASGVDRLPGGAAQAIGQCAAEA